MFRFKRYCTFYPSKITVALACRKSLATSNENSVLSWLPLHWSGDFTGWLTSREDLPLDDSGVPPGAMVCYRPYFRRVCLISKALLTPRSPPLSWFTLEQRINLKGEGLWEELLDVYQPDICIQDWYEDSKLHEEIYQLQVRLLAADEQTVLQEFKLNPKNNTAGDPNCWLEVSHVFRQYGPGVRHLHFLHRVKTMRMIDFRATRVTDSSVLVKLRD
ncbi:FBX50 protein, partial [Polyodon spathula]|nr:FBX50 protein [Polyodon spathula]